MTRKPSRRDFLYAGYLGGVGLTMADLFRMEQAKADQKFYESKEGTAKSVIFIFFPETPYHAPHQKLFRLLQFILLSF